MKIPGWAHFKITRRGIIFLVLLLSLVPPAVVSWLPGHKSAGDMVATASGQCEAFMEAGLEQMRVGHFEASMGEIRSAIDIAPNRRLRAKSGLAMGRVLINWARSQKGDYALMAQQYLLAAMDEVGRDDPLHRDILNAFVEASGLTERRDTFERLARRLLDATTEPEEKGNIYLEWIKGRTSSGTYLETQKLIDEAQKQIPDYAAGSAFWFQKVVVARKLLTDDAWFQEYRLKDLDEDPQKLRTEIARGVTGWLVKQADQRLSTRSEALFQLAAVYHELGDRANAKMYLRMFMDSEPSRHIDESLLFSANLARQDGDLDGAMVSMRLYCRRYRVFEPAEKEVLALADQLEAKGRATDAYELIKEAVTPANLTEQNLSSVARAARMAGRLGRAEEAWALYRVLLEKKAPAPMIKDLLLAETDIFLQRKDAVEAKKWLMDYLRLARFDPSRPEALFLLFRVLQDENAPMEETLLTGIAVHGTSSAHPLTLDTLLTVATDLEDLGLYGAAQARFSDIALLEQVGISTNHKTLADLVGRASVGEARCVLKSGDKTRANGLFRELCGGKRSDEVKAEAAYWWATMAVDDGQGVEAVRRLGLIRAGALAPSLLGRVDIEKKIAQVLTGGNWKEAVDSIFKRASEMPSREQRECLERACLTLFARLERAANIEGLQYVTKMALDSRVGRGPFFRELLNRLATSTIRNRNMTVLVEFLQPYLSGPDNEIQRINRDDPILEKLCRQILEVQPEVELCL